MRRGRRGACRRTLTEADVEALLAAPDTGTPLGLRDRAMLELLYASGLRVSELVSVSVAQLSADMGVVRMLGKGSKERLVPVGEEALTWIGRYSARPALRCCGPRRRGIVRHGTGAGDVAPGLLEPDQALRAAGRHCTPASRRTRCGTPLQRICSITAPTCAWCRCCSATPTSPPRRSTRTSPASA